MLSASFGFDITKKNFGYEIMKKAIFIGEQAQVDYVYSEGTKNSLMSELDFPYGEKTFVKGELGNFDLSDVSFLFSTWGMPTFTEEEIASYFPNLECVFYAAGTVQFFARPFINRNVKVFSAWVANGVPVAEYSFAQIILATKGFFTRMHIQGSGGVLDDSWRRNFPRSFPGNYDMTVGIISLGVIGKKVVELVTKDLEHVRVLVFSTSLTDEKAKEMGVTKVNLPTLFRESDVISNHMADNAKTKGIMNYDLFKLMKPTCVFINTGRGAQVVEADLVRALKEEPTRAAVLDVTFPEPSPAGHEFYDMKNVIITPHIAGSLGNEVHRMADYMLEEYRLYNDGKPTNYEVTPSMLEKMA